MLIWCSTGSPVLKLPGRNFPINTLQPPLRWCTRHMCPIRVHWHVNLNYKEYWRVNITLWNFNYKMNYTNWTLVAQHPNFDNVTQVFGFNYKSLTPYGSISRYIFGKHLLLLILSTFNLTISIKWNFQNILETPINYTDFWLILIKIWIDSIQLKPNLISDFGIF